MPNISEMTTNELLADIQKTLQNAFLSTDVIDEIINNRSIDGTIEGEEELVGFVRPTRPNL